MRLLFLTARDSKLGSKRSVVATALKSRLRGRSVRMTEVTTEFWQYTPEKEHMRFGLRVQEESRFGLFRFRLKESRSWSSDSGWDRVRVVSVVSEKKKRTKMYLEFIFI